MEEFKDKKVAEILEKLEILGGEVNIHDCTYDAADLLKHAKYIRDLLNEFLEIAKCHIKCKIHYCAHEKYGRCTICPKIDEDGLCYDREDCV